MLESLSYAFGVPPVSGVLRARPEDFFVDEVLGFEPECEGEHVLLQIEKRNTNTQWLAVDHSTASAIQYQRLEKDRMSMSSNTV